MITSFSITVFNVIFKLYLCCYLPSVNTSNIKLASYMIFPVRPAKRKTKMSRIKITNSGMGMKCMFKKNTMVCKQSCPQGDGRIGFSEYDQLFLDK